jgi:ATP-binding cassette subfamily G (WHITE) protein 2 (PDR)
MINEFTGREFDCVSFVPAGPSYTGLGAANSVCSAVGAVAGSATVDGETYINIAYSYYRGHKWRCATIRDFFRRIV